MNHKNVIMCLVIITFSVQSAEKSDTYVDVKALITGISQDLSGNIQKAQDLVTKMQTNPAQAEDVKKDVAHLEILAQNAFQKIKKTFDKLGRDAFSYVRGRMPSIKEETYQEWLKVQDEKLIQLHNDIGVLHVRARGMSEPVSPASPRSESRSPRSPVSPSTPNRPMSPSVSSPRSPTPTRKISTESTAAVQPVRQRRSTGEGAQAVRVVRKEGYVVSGSATPEAGGPTKTITFGGAGLPPKVPKKQ